jgi:Flp pilus assembly protein TadG
MGRKKQAMVRRRGRGLLGIAGTAAVELAITAPVLVVLVFGIADYGVLMGTSASLEGAARAGAEVAKVNSSVTAGQLTALNIFPTGVTPTLTPVCTCADNTWPGVTACPPPLTGVNPCTNVTNPYTNLTDPRVLQYVKVTAPQTFNPPVPYGSFTSSKSLNPQTTTRTQ